LTLRVLVWRQKKEKPSVRCDPHSKMNDKWRSRDELKKKIEKLTEERQVVNKRVKKLEDKITEMTKDNGVEVCTPKPPN
jgi:cell division protein FtsB